MSVQTQLKRVTVPEIRAHKNNAPVVCLTCYHAHTARLLDNYVDLMLVGDSLGQVMHGLETPLGVTLDMMITHAKAVMRGSSRALVTVDMPFGSYEESPAVAFRNAARVIQETGATAVKLEGGTRMAETIHYLSQRGIPVMGHIGLTPQSIHRMGGHRVQGRKSGRSAGCRERLLEDAMAIEQAGAFAMVLEGIPAELAREITERASVPTIGIGAGIGCDGQVLVMHDVLGLSESYMPRFAKPYANLWQDASAAATSYIREVRERSFPTPEHSYGLKGA